jgi:hypothetical protein
MQGGLSQLTGALSLDSNPVWSSDGRQIFYQSNPSNIYSRSVTDGTPEQLLLKERTMIYPSAISPDGSVLLYTRATVRRRTSGMCRSVPTARLTHSSDAFHERDGNFLPTASGSRINRMTRAISRFTCSRFPAPAIGFRSLRRRPAGALGKRRVGTVLYCCRSAIDIGPRDFGANGKLVLGTPVPSFELSSTTAS